MKNKISASVFEVQSKWNWIAMHASRASAVALSTVLRAIMVSYGRPPTLTPCNSETVVTIDTKICRIDYVVEISECAKIGCNRLCSCLSPYVWNITSIFFIFFISRFWDSRTARTKRRRKICNGSNDAYITKKVPFVGFICMKKAQAHSAYGIFSWLIYTLM